MNSRERMTKFFAGEAVDRVPNAWGGCETAGMHMLAYDNLKKVLGVTDPTSRMYTFMSNAVFEPSVIDAMEGDMIVLNSKMCPAPLWGKGAEGRWKNHSMWGMDMQVPNEWQFEVAEDGTIWWGPGFKCPPGCHYFDGMPDRDTHTALPDMDNQESPDDYNPSHELPEEFLRELEDAAKFLYETTDYAICIGESIQDLQHHSGGNTAWWMRMVAEPQACHDFLDKAVDAALANLKQIDQALGKYASAMIIADDIGDCRGVTCGPDLWRSIYKPHYKRLWQTWKTITPMKSLLHSCGSIIDILPDFVDCGLDIINPVQLSARGMDPVELGKQFGKDLIFYGGGLDAVVTPPWTPAQEVYEAAKATITAFASQGRYMLAGTHNLPGDTPPEHLEAMLQAWRDVREDPALTGGIN